MNEREPDAGGEWGSDAAPRPEAARSGRGGVGWGVGLALLLLAVGTPINMFVFQALSRDELAMIVPLLFLGFGQLVYAVPAAALLWRRGRTDTLKGLAIASGTVLLLNGLCTGAMYYAG